MRAPALTLFLPRENRAISGGNLYNSALLAALRRLTEVASPGVEALDAVLDAGSPGTYLLDSLDLAAAPAIERRASGQRFGLLVHHLPSLEPGLTGAGHQRELELERRVLGRFDFWVTTSQFAREVLLERGLSPERVIAVLPGLSPVERGVRELRTPLRVLWVGNLLPRKALYPLLTALSELGRVEDDFELEIAGRDDADPAYAEACRRAASSNPWLAERVTFRGAVPPPEMPELYRKSALFVSSSEMETFGMALQEARAFGVPILALDRGNARAHVESRKTGLLVSSLRELCATLLGFTRAPETLRPLFDGAAHAVTPNPSWEDSAEELLAALELENRPAVDRISG